MLFDRLRDPVDIPLIESLMVRLMAGQSTDGGWGYSCPPISDDEVKRLFEAARATLADWIERLRREAGGEFPEGVTAFRPDMAVHGRFRQPCPDCGAPVQRIVYAENETNYCPRCQTGDRLLADRGLSRLLKQDWPRTIEELEARKPRPRPVVPAPGS